MLGSLSTKNHAIRRADLGRRVLETLSPASNANKKGYQFWTWIRDKLGLRNNANTEPEEYDIESLMYPWHLIKSDDDSLFVINRR